MEIRRHPTLPHILVREDGRIFQELVSSSSDNGYHTVKIGNGQTVRRHTLVAEAFHGPRPYRQGVRHLDGNPANDHQSNLAWGTQADNLQDMIDHGRSQRGESNTNAKLTEAQAREIKRRRAAGESGRSLAIEFDISEQTVCCIHTGRHWSWI